MDRSLDGYLQGILNQNSVHVCLDVLCSNSWEVDWNCYLFSLVDLQNYNKLETLLANNREVSGALIMDILGGISLFRLRQDTQVRIILERLSIRASPLRSYSALANSLSYFQHRQREHLIFLHIIKYMRDRLLMIFYPGSSRRKD